MLEFLRATLDELARLARNPDTRIVQQSKEDPTDWRPTQVIDPRTNIPFTEAGAWEYVAEQFESGHSVNPTTLKKPQGKVGYTMNIVTSQGKIYVKVRTNRGRIIGRSFHYSKHE